MIPLNRYSVQFMDARWKSFSMALVTDDLQRAKKFCAAMVAFNPHVEKGRVIDMTAPWGLSPDDGVVFTVDNEHKAELDLRAMLGGA
jgi:hypothetical protein